MTLSKKDKDKLLDELVALQKQAIRDTIPDAPLIRDILRKLNGIPDEDKSHFESFATQLENDLFQRNVSLRGLDLSAFQKNVVKKDDSQSVTASQKSYSEVQTELSELVKNLRQTILESHEILKGYYLVKLENDPLVEYKLLVLHDDKYFVQPIKNKIKKWHPACEYMSIEELSEQVELGNQPGENLLCLFLILPKPNDEESIKKVCDQVRIIINGYNSFKVNTMIDDKVGTVISSSDKEDFIDLIDFQNSTVLSNTRITNEEEIIIKKLFREFQTPLLIYKSLKGGNSGSPVFEIRPKKSIGIEFEKRYIIKFSKLSDERKIYNESRRFGKWIEGYRKFNEYEHNYVKTTTHEGLRYSYAISPDSTAGSESFSFSNVVGDSKNEFHTKLKSIIEDLFSIELYGLWKDSLEDETKLISDLYSDYVKIDKTFDEIKKILNLSASDIEKNELYVNFFKIWRYELTTNVKVCHGDLHSENFFIDRDGIYLIDFGFTGMRHSVIDHTSLEASLKFKHIPNYIPIEELCAVENELLLESSFQIGTRFTKTKRRNFLEILELIKRIRNNSLNLRSVNDSPIEYLISLFIITFRQIRYSDLNQKYAYHSALILSKKIVQLKGA